MARKKSTRKKKSVSRKKPALKKKLTARKKLSTKRKAAPREKATARKKTPAKKKAAKKSVRRKSVRQAGREANRVNLGDRRGMGAESAGQSGDTQGLSRRAYSDSESVEELLEEGQYLEAEAVGGVEDARDPDEGGVTTSEEPEDDVPEEYLDRD